MIRHGLKFNPFLRNKQEQQILMSNKEQTQPPTLTEDQLMLLWLKHEEEKQLTMLETMQELPEQYQLESISQLSECHSR